MAETRMKHTVRRRKLSREETTKYKKIREQIEKEKPDITSRHRARMFSMFSVDQTFRELRKLRVEKGLSLADLQDLTGMDRSAISKLETGERENPTVTTMVRYAQAVGKKIVVALVDDD